MSKPITLHSHASGPNPHKVAIILEELGVPYQNVWHQFPELKQDPFESINPNGRVPAIEDPNTGVKVWESGACIDYILETYDQAGKLSPAANTQAKWDTRGWRDFQMSGQGPYFGQAMWFSRFHSEKLPSAVERYRNEAKRVVGVIDRHLTKTKTEYLTGPQITYADLMFVPWFLVIGFILPEGTDAAKDFPTFNAWIEKIKARPAVAKVIAARDKAIADGV